MIKNNTFDELFWLVKITGCKIANPAFKVQKGQIKFTLTQRDEQRDEH